MLEILVNACSFKEVPSANKPVPAINLRRENLFFDCGIRTNLMGEWVKSFSTSFMEFFQLCNYSCPIHNGPRRFSNLQFIAPNSKLMPNSDS